LSEAFLLFVLVENFSALPVWKFTASNESSSLRRESLSRLLWWFVAGQPPRHASAEPEAWHVACFLAAVGVPRFDPGPEGEGGRVQNAGKNAASVGRRPRWTVSCGLAVTFSA
jgi:hypothetical protein